MKTTTILPIRVAPEFRLEVEGVLEQGEFLRRGIAAIEETKRTGEGIAAEAVVAKLEAKLAAARRTQSQRQRQRN